MSWLWVMTATGTPRVVVFFGSHCGGQNMIPYLCADFVRCMEEGMRVEEVTGRNRTLKSGLGRLRLKCDGTRAETRFRLYAKRTSPFKSAGASFCRLLAAEVCASAVVMLDTPCSEVVATHSISVSPSRPFPCVTVCHHVSTGLYRDAIAPVHPTQSVFTGTL